MLSRSSSCNYNTRRILLSIQSWAVYIDHSAKGCDVDVGRWTSSPQVFDACVGLGIKRDPHGTCLIDPLDWHDSDSAGADWFKYSQSCRECRRRKMYEQTRLIRDSFYNISVAKRVPLIFLRSSVKKKKLAGTPAVCHAQIKICTREIVMCPVTC